MGTWPLAREVWPHGLGRSSKLIYHFRRLEVFRFRQSLTNPPDYRLQRLRWKRTSSVLGRPSC